MAAAAAAAANLIGRDDNLDAITIARASRIIPMHDFAFSPSTRPSDPPTSLRITHFPTSATAIKNAARMGTVVGIAHAENALSLLSSLRILGMEWFLRAEELSCRYTRGATLPLRINQFSPTDLGRMNMREAKIKRKGTSTEA